MTGTQPLAARPERRTLALLEAARTEPHPFASKRAESPSELIIVSRLSRLFTVPVTARTLLSRAHRPRPRAALTDVSFCVAGGEAVALTGPNGAGKSTLLRILAGLLAPTTGDARIGGIGMLGSASDRARLVGYVPAEDRGAPPRLSVREHLAWYAALYAIPRGEALCRVDTLLESVELQAHAGRAVPELSTGMRRRLAFARARISDPRVILLDEPTRGVDADSAALMRRQLISLRNGGCAILIATHDREDIHSLCDRGIHLVDGRLTRPEACSS